MTRNNDELTVKNRCVIPGQGACYISVHPSGKYLFTANYLSGDIVSCRINDNGEIGEVCDHVIHKPQGEKGSHCHCVISSVDGCFVAVTNLGLDQVYVYQFDEEKGQFVKTDNALRIELEAGVGPRHFIFHSNGKWGFLVTENGNQVIKYQYDGEGGLTHSQTISSLPVEYNKESYIAGAKLSRDGRYLYVSNRGYDMISVIKINQQDGRIQLVNNIKCNGTWPRDLELADDFLAVANQKEGNIAFFKIKKGFEVVGDTEMEVRIDNPACIIHLDK